MHPIIAEAQSPEPFVIAGVVAIFTIIVFLAFVLLLMKQYKRCPPNRLMVIFGKTRDRTQITIHGGAVFVWPLIQDYAYLSLDPIPLELPKEIRGLGLDKGVKLPKTWTFAISTDDHLMQYAAIRLLGLPRQEIERLADDIIVGRIEKNLDQMQNPIEPHQSVALVEQWVGGINADLAQLGLVTIGYT